MSQPGPDAAVDDSSEGEDGVETEGHRDEAGRVVEGRLNRVHVGTCTMWTEVILEGISNRRRVRLPEKAVGLYDLWWSEWIWR